MDDSKNFELDFTEAKAIPDTPGDTTPPTPTATSKTNRLDRIWGFSAQAFGDKASGPAALGTMLHFHEIGWNHLPRHQNGRPVNDPYIAEIIRWSSSPDLLSGSLGSSPALMLNSLRKASLTANWYAGNPPGNTLDLIANELNQQRPVIVLINHCLQGHPLLLEWQVVFKMDESRVHTKHSAVEDGTLSNPIEAFTQMISIQQAQLSCSVITASKD